MTDKQRRLTIKIIIVLTAALILYSIYYYINNLQYDSTLNIRSVPDTVTMSYDGVTKTVKSNSAVSVRHGKHTYKFSAEGFDSYSIDIEIKKGEENYAVFALNPTTDKAKEEAKKSKYNVIYDGIASRKTTVMAEKISEKSPLVNHMPYYTRWYYIITCEPYRNTKESGHIGICITISGQDTNSSFNRAIEYLKKYDNNLDNYDIKINGSIYPTTKEIENGIARPCGGSSPSWCYNFAQHS